MHSAESVARLAIDLYTRESLYEALRGIGLGETLPMATDKHDVIALILNPFRQP